MKPIWKSKTAWVAVGTFIASLLTFLMGNEFVAQNPKLVSILGMVLGVINVVLRTITSTAVRVMGGKKRERMNYE